jgi:hypothetical protein
MEQLEDLFIIRSTSVTCPSLVEVSTKVMDSDNIDIIQCPTTILNGGECRDLTEAIPIRVQSNPFIVLETGDVVVLQQSCYGKCPRIGQ